MNNKFKDSIIKVLAVIGVIGLLSVGGFFTVLFFSNLPDIASGLTAQVVSVTKRFVPAGGDDIVITLNDDNPRNGETVTISFEHLTEKNGSYSFFYECREGIHFERNNEIIFCNTPYNFVNQNNTLSFNVSTTNSQRVNVPLSVNFTENNSTRISERGGATLKVDGNIESIPVSPIDGGTIFVAPENSPPVRIGRTSGDRVEETILFDETSGRRPVGSSDPNGYVDLRPKIIAVGEVDKNTNEFSATSSVHFSSRGAIKFEVENIGTKISPTWTFNLVLPTLPRHIYYSKNQQALLPGDKIEYIVGFDSIKRDSEPNTIIVNIDPVNSVKEKDRINNIVKMDLPTFGG
jgi:hypothetical protein